MINKVIILFIYLFIYLFIAVLALELRAYTLSHSTSLFLMVFFKIGSSELFICLGWL
jgi:hypothetical protein